MRAARFTLLKTTKKKNKLKEEVPRFALLEEAIDDIMGKQDLGTRAKTDKDVSLLKKAFFQRKVDLRKVKVVSPA